MDEALVALRHLADRTAGGAKIIRATPEEELSAGLVAELYESIRAAWEAADTELAGLRRRLAARPRQATVYEFDVRGAPMAAKGVPDGE